MSNLKRPQMLLPDQVYGEEIHHFSEMSEEDDSFEVIDDYAQEMRKLLKSLEIWDDIDLLENHQLMDNNWSEKCQRFLSYHNIRPDFFCQYEKILSDFDQKRTKKRRLNFDNGTITGKTHLVLFLFYFRMTLYPVDLF